MKKQIVTIQRSPASRLDDLMREARAATDGSWAALFEYMEPIVRNDFALMDHLWHEALMQLIRRSDSTARKISPPVNRFQRPTEEQKAEIARYSREWAAQERAAGIDSWAVCEIQEQEAEVLDKFKAGEYDGKTDAEIAAEYGKSLKRPRDVFYIRQKWERWRAWKLSGGLPLAEARRPEVRADMEHRVSQLLTMEKNWKLLQEVERRLPNDEVTTEEVITEEQMDRIDRFAHGIAEANLQRLALSEMTDEVTQ